MTPIRRSGSSRRATTVRGVSSASDTRTLIEQATTRFLEEVPALQKLKMVITLELRGRGDIQQYRVEVPGPKVSKGYADDGRLTLEVVRSTFNELAADGHVADWQAAFEKGTAKVQGPVEIQRLISQVVEKQLERAKLRRARR
jgi:hypothetical protein